MVWRERLNRTKFGIQPFSRFICIEREFDWIIFHWNENDVFTHHRVRFKRHQGFSKDTLQKTVFRVVTFSMPVEKSEQFRNIFGAKVLLSQYWEKSEILKRKTTIPTTNLF